MTGDWEALAEFLRDRDGPAVVPWDQLTQIVGSLPPSALRHRAWWSGDRPHVRAWRAAGLRISAIEPGASVTFVRDSDRSAAIGQNRAGPPGPDLGAKTTTSPVLLLTCVKGKRREPGPAKDLYTSPLFVKARAYAETAGRPWFILSAEHGLVAPDEWLAPYERYLPDTPARYRQAWGRWVVARLELLLGDLNAQVFEIHAGDAYVAAVAGPLRQAGGTVLTPLAGLPVGRRLQWYDDRAEGAPAPEVVPASVPGSAQHRALPLAAILADEARCLSVPTLLALEPGPLQRPGLYSWWVDEAGAADLSRTLPDALRPGIIYAGQSGATRWPSGGPSSNTLWKRLVGMHLGRRHEFSTFRRTLASLLVTLDEVRVDEGALTTWMTHHLRVVAHPLEDADTLADLEHAVLQLLDPPLNLRGMAGTPNRAQLSKARKALREREAASAP